MYIYRHSGRIIDISIMAFSKSIVTAQESILCQLCETEPKLKFKCLECDLLMCTKCTEKVHLKFRNAKNHKVIDIKEVGQTENTAELDYKNIPCSVHSNESCCLNCTTCEKLVCPSCVAKEHAGHPFSEIREFYQETIKKLNDAITHLENKERVLDKEERRVNEIEEHEKEIYSNLQKDIETQRLSYKNDIDRHFDRLAAEAKLRIETTEKIVNKEKKKIAQTRKDFAVKRREYEILKATNDASALFNSTPSLLDNKQYSVQGSNFLSLRKSLKFVPKYKHLTENLLGSLEEASIQEVTRKNWHLKVLKEYTTEFKCCHFIGDGPDGSFFIVEATCTNTTHTIAKILLQNDTIKTTFKKVIPIILDIETLLPTSKDILLADRTPILKLMNGSTGRIKESKYNAGSLLIIGAHVSLDNKIIVGTRSQGHPFPVQGRRVVIVMDIDGKYQAEWECDKHGKRLFCVPRPTASVSNGNIFIRDVLSSDNNGQVIVMSSTGYVLNNYMGHPDINNDISPFTPTGMTRTPSDNVIVCDFNNHALHVLNNEGVPLSNVNTYDIGIKFPHCITFNMKVRDIMYIGCTTFIQNTEKAKLYQVEFSETE